MAISGKDRKVLWGRSGSRCALCRRPLVAAKTAQDAEAVVGDEAHIAAQSADGPRFGDLPGGVGVDAYDNLILLCRVDHKKVDDQPRHFTAEKLRQIKQAHEAWVAGRLDEPDIPGLYDPITESLRMTPLTTGALVWQHLRGAQASYLDGPSESEVDPDAVDLADEFLQVCSEYVDLASNINDQGRRAIRDAIRYLQDYLPRLAEHGLLVFGAKQVRSAPGQPSVLFDVVFLTVIRADHPGIQLSEPEG